MMKDADIMTPKQREALMDARTLLCFVRDGMLVSNPTQRRVNAMIAEIEAMFGY